VFSKTFWRLLRLSRQLGVRITLIAVLAIVAAGAAAVIDPLIPDRLVERLGPESVMPILDILSTSMLAVTTFSLSVMVSVHRSASSQVTPRSHRVLLEDTTTQTVLATFIGAFIFALVASILFRAGVYEGGASVVVFAVTVGVVGLVILAILRWIDHLSDLGSMDEMIRVVERRAENSLRFWRKPPHLGGSPLNDGIDAIPSDSAAVPADATGYVQFIDMAALSHAAEADDLDIYVSAPPGHFVLKDGPVAHIVGTPSDIEKTSARIAQAFTIADVRSFEQDARFGFVVLAEVATRALSPGINDQGTAIDVIGRLERLLWRFGAEVVPDEDIRHPRVWVPPTRAADLVHDAYAAIARDGGAKIEIAIRLQQALARLQKAQDTRLRTAARDMAETAHAYAEGALPLAAEREALRRMRGLG